MLGLYPIFDLGPALEASQAPALLEAAIEAGVRMVQLRAKTLGAGAFLAAARQLAPLAAAHGVDLIINDRPDVAALSEARGVHLGQDDLPPALVRRWLAPPALIGVSTHDLVQVERAKAEGVADYLGFGPVFPTRSKERPDPVVGLAGLEEAVRLAAPLPVVAIGGIDQRSLGAIRRTGASGAAVISAYLNAPDPALALRQLVTQWMAGA